jgi:ubiquitin-conjugating enzyme E2 M
MMSMYSKRRGKKTEEDDKDKEKSDKSDKDKSSSSSSSSSDSKDSDEKDKKKDKDDDDDGTTKKLSSAQLRLQGDFADIDIPKMVKVVKKEDDAMQFSFIIYPDSGYWKGGQYEFAFKIPSDYPFKEPKVQCIDKIYHPNINYEGAVCVNVLRPWKSTYTIQLVLFGLLFLFTDPNPNDVLEKDPADVLRKDPTTFARNVLSAMRGNSVNSVEFPKNKGTGFK